MAAAHHRYVSLATREAEDDEEIECHLSMLARERIEEGSDPVVAAFAVRRKMGDRTQIQEATRSVWIHAWLELESL